MVKVNTQCLLNTWSSTQLIGGVCRQDWQRNGPHNAFSRIQCVRRNTRVVQNLWDHGTRATGIIVLRRRQHRAGTDKFSMGKKLRLFVGKKLYLQLSFVTIIWCEQDTYAIQNRPSNTFYTMGIHKAEYEDYGKLLKPQEQWSENKKNITSLITLSQRKSHSISTILMRAEEKQYGLKK